MLALLMLFRFKQKGHRNLCARSRSYQEIWRKVKLRPSADSIRHRKSERMASFRVELETPKRKGGCLFQEVKWEPGTTQNHKTFHAQAAQRPPQKNKCGQGEASKQKHSHWELEKQIKAAKAKARKGEVKGRICERRKAKMVRDDRFNFPEMLQVKLVLVSMDVHNSGAYYCSNI